MKCGALFLKMFVKLHLRKMLLRRFFFGFMGENSPLRPLRVF
jgi:hypothetical protein